MPRLEPALLRVVTDLERGLRDLGVSFAVVGALVPELLLESRPTRMTNDADVAVSVDSLSDFEALKGGLAAFGFRSTRASHRLQHHTGGLVDVLPVSRDIAPGGRLELERDLVLNMAGFEHVVPNAMPIAIEDGPTLPVIPLPLYAVLKLVAFSDRKAGKDLAGVYHGLRHYLEHDERRYDAEHEGVGVPFEYTGAFLLGLDGRPFVSAPVAQALASVLGRFVHADAGGVSIVLGELERMAVEDNMRAEVCEAFQWYGRGIGL